MFWYVIVLCTTVVTAIHLPPKYPADSSAFITVDCQLQAYTLTEYATEQAEKASSIKVAMGTKKQVANDGATYDFVVVGAGAAGCVVAARLSELGATVLLLEAGDDPDIRSRVPSLAQWLLASNVDWHYPTLPNGKSCLASQAQQCSFSKGKALGGCTIMNYMMYVRGNRLDYDDWNITGWTWNDLKSYFLKFEGLKDLDKLPNSSYPYHKTDGPVTIEFFSNSENDWHQWTINGFEDLGFPYNHDVNAQSQIGVSQVNGYVNDGERETSARAYLSSAVDRKNLVVAKNAHVTQVILDNSNVALGVRAVLNGNRTVNLYANKEVILSAGAIGTPQILMLSGIGSSTHLQSVGVTIRVNLPGVGDGLADHIMPLVFVQVDRGFGINFPNMIPFVDDSIYYTKWLATMDGPYASNGLTDISAFINTACYDFENHKMINNKSPECELPNLQYMLFYIDRDFIPTAETLFANALGLNDETVKQLRLANVNHALLMISPVLLAPESRGWVRLNSSDPFKLPNIFPNYLDSQKDIDDLVLAMKIVEDISETPTFKSHGSNIVRLEFDACSGLYYNTDQYRECYIRHMTFHVFHDSCTTALGRVVDEELKVKGVGRLRVADCGVMPKLPRGNTAAACFAIGEKAADLVAKTYNLNLFKGSLLL